MRKSFFQVIFICLLVNAKSQTTPNIIILLADDLGYSDLSCYGGDARTPNLDAMAAKGIRFTDFYAAASNCSPSRAGMLTGKGPSKVGMYNYLSANHPMHLPAHEITVAEIARKAGYTTGHFGKWHVSTLEEPVSLSQPQPSEQGFDHSFGTSNNAHPDHFSPTNFVRNGIPVGETHGYSCDLVVAEAIRYMRRSAYHSQPFMAYLAFHEPHKKVASPPELIAHYSQYKKDDAQYLANVENLDEAIGRLMQFLRSENLDTNTFILFASDNGSYRNGSNVPLLGGKSFVYEGGIRVPGILWWNKIQHKGMTISKPCGLIDVMPTICDLLQVSHPNHTALDGTSILPLLRGEKIDRTKPLAWFFYRTSPEMAMRIGDHTLLGIDLDTTKHTHPLSAPDMHYIKNMDLDIFELYDLSNDIGQSNNIFREYKGRKKMQKLLVKRLQEIQITGPYWENLPPANGNKKLKTQWRQLRPEGFSN